MRERLRRADLDLIVLGKSDLADTSSLLARLGSRFEAFWQDEPLPGGPFKGATQFNMIERAET